MPIEVSSHSTGEAVSHSLLLLAGCISPLPTQATVKISNLTLCETLDAYTSVACKGGVQNGLASTSCVTHGDFKDEDIISYWPIFNTNFKALIPLTTGENVIHLEHGCEELQLTIHYIIPPFTRFVRPVYIVCADDEGYFQAPEGVDCSVASACERIAVGARLLQAFTASKLTEHGFGGKTFMLERDLFPDQPACHVFRSKLRLEEVYSMSGGELWVAFAKELMGAGQFERKDACKWLAFMSFTRYAPPNAGVLPKSHSQVLQFTKGHTALGGGGLALFGTGTLHTWADRLGHVVPCFTDQRKIDRARFMDDSAYRETYWANYSTGLGAALHELGHTFDLAHTPTGIMARGFDDLYRVFTVQPLASRRGSLASESRTASPIAYSPRQSPVHTARKRVNSGCESGSRSNSPVCTPNFHSLPRTRTRHDSGGSTNGSPYSSLQRSRTRNDSGGSTNEVAPYSTFQIECDFKKLSVQTTQSFTIKNYDGSETKKTVSRYRDGMETVAEITWCPTGQELVKETVKNLLSGKTRTVLSLTCVTGSEGRFSRTGSIDRTSRSNSITSQQSLLSEKSSLVFNPGKDASSYPASKVDSAILNGCKQGTNYLPQNGLGDKGAEQEVHIVVKERRSQTDIKKECKVEESVLNLSASGDSKIVSKDEADLQQKQSSTEGLTSQNGTQHVIYENGTTQLTNQNGFSEQDASKQNIDMSLSGQQSESGHNTIVSSTKEEQPSTGFKSSGSQSKGLTHTSDISLQDTQSSKGNTVQYGNADSAAFSKMYLLQKEHSGNSEDVHTDDIPSQVDVKSAQSVSNQGPQERAIFQDADTTQSVSSSHLGTSKGVSSPSRVNIEERASEADSRKETSLFLDTTVSGSSDSRCTTNAGCSNAVNTDQGCTESSRDVISEQGTMMKSNIAIPVTRNSNSCRDKQDLNDANLPQRNYEPTLNGHRSTELKRSLQNPIDNGGDIVIPKPTRVVQNETLFQELRQSEMVKTGKTCHGQADAAITTDHGKPKAITTHMDHITTQHVSTPSRITTPHIMMPGLAPCPDGILYYRPRRKDGGAHWYRASAVILSCHKWFNTGVTQAESFDPPSIEGFKVTSAYGLRLVEIRHPPEGAVVHHWEFPSHDPMTSFSLPVDQFYDILGKDIRQFTVLAIDRAGNVVKKKYDLDDIAE